MGSEYYHSDGFDKLHREPEPGDRFFRHAHRTFEGVQIITASVWLEIDYAGEKQRRAGFKIINKASTIMRSWSGERANGEDYFTVQTFGDSEVGTFSDALVWIGETLRRLQASHDDTAERAAP